ncbi:hypothetical protein ACFO0S_02295 [Chryseomicrobium palamuruense]|uniref:Transposase n=1 Tax=Chryseomicrobium palamuruense TaxID=682973 RepID=A0ABV8UTL9_9BACL
MVSLIHFASIVSVITLSLFKDVSDKQYKKNIDALRQEIWFQMYWNDPEYQAILKEDPQLRKIICYINREKLEKQRYAAWQRKKIITIVEKKAQEVEEDTQI